MKMNKEFFLKVGDKVIANNEFHWYGFIDGEVIEVTPYNNDVYVVNFPRNIEFGATILGRFKRIDQMSGVEYEYKERVYTCSIKVNPTNPDINIDWTGYGSYSKAIFFTSEEEKKKFYDAYNEANMNYHLGKAVAFGYKIN